jgi:G3E family GTPase
MVLAGFLGSGKTTVLNHLLSHSLDVRIGVIVNDFGSIGVDAMLVGGQAAGMVSMGNGCLCCAVGEGGVAPLLEQLSGPDSGVEVIVIEASGIAEPGVLVQLVLSCENPRITFGGLVEVVDLAEFEGTREMHAVLDRHIALADLVVLNKADRVDAATLDRVRTRCRTLNSRAPLVPTRHGRLDPRVLFDVWEVSGRQLMLGQVRAETEPDLDTNGCAGGGDRQREAHLHAAYRAVAFRTERPMAPRALMDWLERRPAGIYRIKGFVHFGAPGYPRRHLLHTVGRYLRFDPTPWPKGEPRQTAMELIGTDFDPERLHAELTACTRDTPAADDDMLAVLRYTFTDRGRQTEMVPAVDDLPE